jgi:hypothetical protein
LLFSKHAGIEDGSFLVSIGARHWYPHLEKLLQVKIPNAAANLRAVQGCTQVLPTVGSLSENRHSRKLFFLELKGIRRAGVSRDRPRLSYDALFLLFLAGSRCLLDGLGAGD